MTKTDNPYLQFLRYTLVGGVAFVVDFLALYILTDKVGLYYLWSATLAFILGLLTNYFLSIRWVFSARKVHNKMLEFAIFTGIGAAGLGINNLALWLLTDKLHIYYLASKIVATTVVYLWNFFVRKYVLFR